jgi:hypothetical protein
MKSNMKMVVTMRSTPITPVTVPTMAPMEKVLLPGQIIGYLTGKRNEATHDGTDEETPAVGLLKWVEPKASIETDSPPRME